MKSVQVLWIDAESSDEWDDVEYYQATIDEEMAIIETEGKIISESEKHIIIGMNYDKKNNSTSMTMKIPKEYVLEVYEMCRKEISSESTEDRYVLDMGG